MEARDVRRNLTGVPETAVDLAFADLAALPDVDMAEVYHRAPLNDLGKAAPSLIGLNMAVALVFLWFGLDKLPRVPLLWWFGAVAVASLWAAYSGYRQRAAAGRASVAEARSRAIFIAMLIGGPWAACSALFLGDTSGDFRVVIVAIAMGASGLGAITLARLPWVALTFSSLLTAALALSLLRLSMESALIVAAYGVALALVVMLSYRREYRYAAQLMESSRQAEIIALLLREFETGSSDWIWETGPDGRLTYVSDRMAQILERDRDRLVGATLMQAAGRARRAGTWRQVAQKMAGQATLHEILVPVSTRKGTMWWQITARALFAADGTFRGYRGVGKDVTVRRQSEINVLNAKQAAEHESRTKSEFLAVMSHELRTPLNSIVGFSQMLAEEKLGPHTDPNYTEYAKSIYQSGCHLTSLINDILDITRFERGSISLVEQEVDLVELVEVCLKMCRQTAVENRVGLVENHAFTQLEVMGDITRLRQVLINLITNAIKFSPPDGNVEAKVDRSADGRVTISVTDTGIGIEATKLERIFEPFAQVDGGLSRRFGGLGLGLAVARRMARLHGGDVVITSRPGIGTIARLVLPANRVLAATARPAAAERAA